MTSIQAANLSGNPDAASRIIICRVGEAAEGRTAELQSEHAGSPCTPRAFIIEAAKANTDACIDWPFSRTRTGYGHVRNRGMMRVASRVVCELAHGQPAGGLECAHSCGNRLCVNPRHLRWATRHENHADKRAHGTVMVGSRNHRAKLTADDALAILRMAVAGDIPDDEIAKRFGVSMWTVRDIATGQSWGDLFRGEPRRVNGNRSLCEEDVRAIRTLKSEGVPHKEMALRFGVSKRTITLVVNRHTWAWVSP